ncbi:hypothetical protein EVG20_g1121 [Dentipellis fragilis]|uniref:DNA 3'-5' helicase n=1 Tax=Dentipellis fragilis TaxID=205917 RepID=A0A4Y9ZDG5_9AGAM|nr:hypothetical protein EVG20_g1121 [Dentipellis fragilis]
MNTQGPSDLFYDDYMDGDIQSIFSPEDSEAWAADPVFGVPGHEHNASMYEYMDEIENSSPSPPERRQSGMQPRYSKLTTRLPMDQSDEIAQFEDDVDYRNQEPPHLDYASPHDPYRPSRNASGFRLPNARHHPFQPHQPAFPPSFPSHNQAKPPKISLFKSSLVAPPSRVDGIIYGTNEQDMSVGPYNGTYHVPQVESSSSTSQKSIVRESNPQNGRGIRLRPVSDLPAYVLADVYRGIFKFGVFNAIQSSCFDTIMESDKNMIISAPTGSGKTVIFELSIIHMLLNSAGNAQDSKCVYMAPTKALCSERYRDWASKFDGLGIKCCEMTGDTVQLGKGAWGDAKDASIIITTGEKWDSLTRNWRDHDRILSQIQLFLVDEVHILNETRGSTLEVVISRMKARGTAFGEEFRPCQLKRFVYGFPKGRGQNDFTYAKSLSYRLFSILQQHIAHKPILVFCPTRNGVLATAEQLAADYAKALESRQPLPWKAPTHVQQTFHDKRLEKLAQVGIGAHHAGLTIDDKRAVEDLYLRKILPVVVATSTLAVGVNLPAHTVVINGVKLFQNGTSQEYSDLDIMQMMGRAGRPQFDKEGVAIIMCETELENKYKQLSEGRTLLESSLHRNLPEHLNSEVGLGTITDMESAKEWLHNSFLFRRIQKNPAHYAIGKQNDQTWQERVDDMVLQSIEGLRSAGLLAEAEEGSQALSSTEYGDIMSKFYIRQSTMTLIINLPGKASLRDMLEMISNSEELSDLKLRAGERSVYNKIRDHEDIRFRIKKVEKASDKLFLLLQVGLTLTNDNVVNYSISFSQAVLGGISLNSPEFKAGDSQPHLEVFSVFRHVGRIARAVVEVALVKNNGLLIKNAQELVRILSAKAWEDRPTIFRQIEYIGEKSIKVFAENGITTFEQLRQQPPYRIETLLNRKQPGFGYNVLAAVADLPQYFLKVTNGSVQTSEGQGPVEIELTIECGLKAEGSATVAKSKKYKPYALDYTSILTLTSDMELVDFRRIPTKVLKSNSKSFSVTAQLTKPSQSVYVYISSESIAGVTVTRQYKPKIDSNQFPVPDTRPKNAIDADLEGLEDVPEFWDVSISDEEIPIKDLTKAQPRTHKEQAQKGASGSSKSKGGGDTKEPVAEPKMLPNGKYACRDGLDKPAPAPKQRNSQTRFDKPKSSTSHASDSGWKKVHQPKPKPKPKEKPDPAERKAKGAANRQDKSMQQLESLHASTNVAANLKIEKNRRLKLPEDLSGPSEGSRKGHTKRLAPKFDLEFCELEDKNAKKSSALEEFEKHDSDSDDMPALAEVLHASAGKGKDKGKGKNKRKSGSDTSCSFADSEVDQLILYAAEDPTIDLTLEEDHAMDYAPSQEASIELFATVDDSSPLVLGRLFRPGVDGCDCGNVGTAGEDDSKPDWGLTIDDDFILDESLFTIVDDADNPPKTSTVQPLSSAALDNTQARRPSPAADLGPEIPHSEFFWDAPPAWTTPPVWTAPAARTAPPAPHASGPPAARPSQAVNTQSFARVPSPVKEVPAPRELDALEEFEAWLASGSVIIVDDPAT